MRGSLQGFSSEGSQTLSLAAGEKKDIVLDPTLDLAALDKVSSAAAASFEVKLLVDGKVVSSGSHTTKVLPKNTVFWTRPGEKTLNANEAMVVVGALTTPHDAQGAVDGILRDAASLSAFKSMIGYQYQASVPAAQHSAAARDQVGAIYNALKARGVVYSSVTTDFFASSQYVRFPSESIKALSANCIDGSLVMASAIEAIGMHPLVVFIPGHAFLIVRAGEKGTPAYDTLFGVETTMIGSKTFAEAVTSGSARFTSTPATSRTVIDLEKVRAATLLPSPFPMN